MCDVDEFKSPNILFLKGVYLRNCKDVGDIMEERLAEIITYGDCDMPKKQKYDKIPRLFTNVETWIKKTNLYCWSCGCTFHWNPVFIPESINFSGVLRNEFKPIVPIGNFCSFLCANNHINAEFSQHLRWEKTELLKILHKIMTGISIMDIPEGPKKTKMVRYGGMLTVGEFQAEIKKICLQSSISYPPGLFITTVDDITVEEQHM